MNLPRPRVRRWIRGGPGTLAAAVTAVLVVATFGEGGGSVAGLLAWHAALLLVLVGVLLAGPRAGLGRRPLGVAPAIGFAVFAALFAVGALRAPYAYAAWLAALELAAFAAVAALAGIAGPRLLGTLAATLPWVAALHGTYAVYQWGIDGAARPAGTFLNTNHLSAWLVCAALIGSSRLAPGRGGWPAALPLVPLLGALLVSGSRGALLGALVALAWLSSRRWAELSRGGRRLVRVAGMLALALVAWRAAARLGSGDPYLFHRAGIWRAALDVFLEAPWWGAGPGQFAIAAERHPFADGEGPLRFDRAYRSTHSDLLRTPCELGFPATLALFGATLAAAFAVRRRLAGPAGGASAAAAGAALIALAVQGLVDNPSSWPAVRLLAAALLGALLSRRRRRHAAPARAPRAALATALLLVFAIGDAGPTRAHWLVADAPADGSALDRAAALNPMHPEYAMRLAERRLAGPAPLDLEAYAAAREWAERAVRLEPADARFRWRLARIEARACLELFRDAASRDRAYARLDEARRRAPGDARVVIESGTFALAVGDVERARSAAEQALALEPLAVPAHVLLAQALLRRDTSAAPRAAELLDRAREIEGRNRATAAASRYAAELLTVDPRRAQALGDEMASAARAAGDPSVARGAVR